jgi:hypothetical protein
MAIDRYRDQSYEQIDVDQWRLSHCSDAGFPINPSYGAGLMQSMPGRSAVNFPKEMPSAAWIPRTLHRPSR